MRDVKSAGIGYAKPACLVSLGVINEVGIQVVARLRRVEVCLAAVTARTVTARTVVAGVIVKSLCHNNLFELHLH